MPQRSVEKGLANASLSPALFIEPGHSDDPPCSARLPRALAVNDAQDASKCTRWLLVHLVLPDSQDAPSLSEQLQGLPPVAIDVLA